jgi:hypothetical protein
MEPSSAMGTTNGADLDALCPLDDLNGATQSPYEI